MLISGLATSLLAFRAVVMFETKMFDNIAIDAVQMLALVFWIALAFVIIWGVAWMRSSKKSSNAHSMCRIFRCSIMARSPSWSHAEHYGLRER